MTMSTTRAAIATAFILPLILVASTASPLGAQQSATESSESVALGPVDGDELPPTDVDRVQVGQSAPDFTLHRYGGDAWSLSDLEGSRNVVLVFFRGHWCQYCMEQLAELTDLLDERQAQRTRIVVVSNEGDALTRRTIGRIEQAAGTRPDFIFLSDPGSDVIGRYGVLNPSGSRRGIPHPATFVIDQEGIVRWRDVQTDYRVRPSNEDIREALADL